ncbi:hypothetical protein JZU71_01165, partial [bacterium]|nr:hypothetical protein [bacterium]
MKPESLALDITYNSRKTVDVPLGKGWTHTYNLLIKELNGGLILKLGDGDRIYFTLSGSSYLPDANSGDTSV